MTPPSKVPAVKQPAATGSAEVKTDVKTDIPPPPKVDDKAGAAAAPATADAYVADPKKWVPFFNIGIGFGAQGGINGTLFGTDSVSTFGEYHQLQIGGGLLRDMNQGEKVRFRLGGRVDYNGIFGNENTGGSNLHQLTIGPRVELDWTRVWGAGLWGVLKGPSYVGIDGGIGYGFGTTTAETYSLHDQKGFAAMVGADLNVINLNIGGLQIDANARFQTTGTFGSEFNSPGNFFGFSLGFRPSVQAAPPRETCTDTNASIDDFTKRNADLRAENTKIKEDLDTLQGLLEKGADPLTTDKIRNALYYREVRLAIAQSLPAVDEAVIRAAVKEAFGAKDDAAADVALKKIPGLTDEMLSGAKATGAKKYPTGYNFWAQLVGDPDTTKVPDPLPTDCKELEKIMKDMAEENALLRERKRSLIGRFDTAVLLDALKDHLGKAIEKFVDKAHGFVLDFVQPNFLLAKPDKAAIDALREYAKKVSGQTVKPSDSELIKIAGRMFALPEWEVQNFSDLADKMNGKLDPSFSRTFTEKDKAKTFDKAPTVADGENKFAWMKDIKWFVEGHTDSQGSNSSNLELSDRRAEAAKLLLQIFGVPQDHLDSKGFGEERLAVPETGSYQAVQTAQNKNRRVVIRVNGSAPSAPINQIPDGKSVNVDPTKPPPDGTPKEGGGATKPLAPTKGGGNPPAPTGNKGGTKTNANPPGGKAPEIDFGDDDKKKK